MIKTILLATTALALIGGDAAAREAIQDGQGTPQDTQGILVFRPDFFAAHRPNTALDMVNRLPGFSIEDGSGARGFEGAVGNVLVNGSRGASKNDTGSNVLSRTTADQVDRIELIRGGAPGIDMQGYPIIANIILKTSSSRQSILQMDQVLFDGGRDFFGASYRFTAREGDRSWGFTLSDGMGMSDSNGTGTQVRRDSTGNIIRSERYANDGGGGGQSGRVNYSGPLGGGKIDATARYGTNDFQNWQELSSAQSLRRSDYAQDSNSGELGLTWTRTLRPSWTLESRLIHEFSSFDSVSAANARVNGVSEPEQRFTGQGDTSETIGRILVRHERSAALTLEGGGELAYNMLDVTQGYSVGGTPIALPSASVKVEETRGEAFGKATWRLRSNLTLEGGLRLETSTISQSGDAELEKNFFFIKPRLLATWTPRPSNQVRLRFERELGQLDFEDFAASAQLGDETVFGGNLELEPEQRWISELVYERRFLGEGIVSIGLRHDEIIGVIDRLPLPGELSATGNIGDGTLDQLSVNLVLPLDKVGFTGGRFTFRNDWNRTRVKDPTSGDERPISGVRPTQASLAIIQDITSWKLNWSVAWLPKLGQGSYNPDQTFTWRGSDYLEIAAEYKPTPTLSLRAQLNLWDDFTTRRTVYANRSDRRVAFVEDRVIDPRTFVSLRLRKTF